jgi:hypothetical protein
LSERRNRQWLWVFLAGMLALFVGGQALAQDIPDAIRTKVTPLDEAETKVVQDYVEAHSKNLQSTDPQLVKKDRDALLQPLEKADTSVPFRITYDKFLIPKITPMMTSSTEMIVINGLILAGDLATDKAVDLVMSKAGDKAPAVRYQVGYAIVRVCRAVHDSQPAVNPNKLPDVLTDLEGRIAQEKDPQVLDAFIRAGLAAAKIDNVQNQAISAVAKGVAKAAKNLNNPAGQKEAEALLRAADQLQLILAQAAGRGVPVNATTAKEAAEMGGVLIARVVRMVEKKQLPQQAGDPLRDACAQLVSAAQKLIQFSGQALQPGGDFQIKDKDGKAIYLNESLKLGTVKGDATFVQDAQLLIGPGGMLSKPPFELPPEEFKGDK